MKEAGAQFIHASAVFGKTVEKIAAVPRPPPTTRACSSGSSSSTSCETKLRKLGEALKEGDEIKAAHEQIRVERASNAANNVSFVFEFHYCRLTPRLTERLQRWVIRSFGAGARRQRAAAPPESTRRTRLGARIRATAARA